MKNLLLLAAPLALMACNDGADENGSAPDGPPGLSGTNPPVPAAPADVAALRSAVCTDVAQFYFETLSSGEYDRAALAWNDPVIDGARLKALLTGYRAAQIEWEEPELETGAGMPTCMVSGTLVDAANDATEPQRGTVTFQRVPDSETAEGQATRWQIERQTFIEPMTRAGRGDPA